MQNIDISNLKNGIIHYRGNPYPIQIKKSHRRSLGLTITPEMEIIFHLPFKASTEDFIAFTERKKRWISKQLLFFEQYQPRTPERKYISGESHLFLGREYRLRLITAEYWKITLSRYYINIYTPNKNHTRAISSRLSSFYRLEAIKIFNKRSQVLEKEHRLKLGYWINLAGVRKMKAKWGVYDQATKSYILNSDLVKAPLICIDYVILHEVVHSKCLDHNSNFFTMMNKLMPDWKAWKEKLELVLA